MVLPGASWMQSCQAPSSGSALTLYAMYVDMVPEVVHLGGCEQWQPLET